MLSKNCSSSLNSLFSVFSIVFYVFLIKKNYEPNVFFVGINSFLFLKTKITRKTRKTLLVSIFYFLKNTKKILNLKEKKSVLREQLFRVL